VETPGLNECRTNQSRETPPPMVPPVTESVVPPTPPSKYARWPKIALCPTTADACPVSRARLNFFTLYSLWFVGSPTWDRRRFVHFMSNNTPITFGCNSKKATYPQLLFQILFDDRVNFFGARRLHELHAQFFCPFPSRDICLEMFFHDGEVFYIA
jgi:hypothetical protein